MAEINVDIVGKIIEGYKIIKPLGRGKFSTVYQAERTQDQKLVALKIIKIFDMMDQKQREKCLQEVKLLQSVDHPNIVKYLDSFISDNELYISIEWADKGDVKRLIKKNIQEGDKIEEIKIVEYIRQLASALSHMHEKRIIHRDLKPANILIFSDGTFKLGDLGLGRYMSDETFKAFSKVGTPLYMSPEVIRNDGYDFKSDVWSLGCVVYELITYKSPFRTDEKISLFDLFNKINKGDYPNITDEKYSNVLKGLVDKMLRVNPEDRIGLEEVIKLCENILKQQEDKPRIDPFIVMEDIVEKFRLINYEQNFCVKYKKDKITKFYFACQCNNKTKSNSNEINSQFILFYELSNWLILLIKQNVNLEILAEFDIKFKKYDKKRSAESQLTDLLNDLKQIGVKVIENSKYINGYGEGVCLILTQLLDKYLINQNFIFKRPKFAEVQVTQIIEQDIEEIIIDPQNEKIMTQIGFTGNYFRRTGTESSKNRFFSGVGKKRFNSAISNATQETNAVSLYTTQSEHFIKDNPNHMILEPSTDPVEWRSEVERVERLLDLFEHQEFNSSNESNLETYNENMENRGINKNKSLCLKKMGEVSYFLESKMKLHRDIKDYGEKIGEELQKISQNEKFLVSKLKNKKILDTIRINKVKLGNINEDKIQLQYRLQTLSSEKEDIASKLDEIKDKEFRLTQGLDSKQNKKRLQDMILSLKREIKMMESKNSFYNAKIIKHIENNKKYEVMKCDDVIFDEVL